ncbi:MAG: hypothetical protein ACJATI_001736 [Halioglobus sp.]|jgi:hypothetical protein
MGFRFWVLGWVRIFCISELIWMKIGDVFYKLEGVDLDWWGSTGSPYISNKQQ